MMNITHLECGLCGLKHEARQLLNLCRACGKPLLVRYDLERAQKTLTKKSLASRRSDLWRYREVLPVENDENIISLGEGWTPLLRASRLGADVGIRELYIKDEAQNPTQSWQKSSARRNSLCHRRETRLAPWLLTRPVRDSKRLSSCRATRRERT
jgi:threonine synthase